MLDYVLCAITCFIIYYSYTYYRHIIFTINLMRYVILQPMLANYKRKLINLCCKQHNTCKKIGKNLYEITYDIGNTTYKILTSKTRGPKKIIIAFDETGNDISDIIESYAGPLEDFHGRSYTPNMLGYKQITISLSNGDELFFEENKIIVIHKD
jgi:hypothetical protein